MGGSQSSRKSLWPTRELRAGTLVLTVSTCQSKWYDKVQATCTCCSIVCLRACRCLCNYAQVPEQRRGPPAGPLARCLSAPRHRSCLAGVCLSPARRTRADPGRTHWWEAVLSLYKSVRHSNGSCMAASWLPIALNWRMKREQAEYSRYSR